MPKEPISPVFEYIPGDNHPHDFIGPLKDLVNAQVTNNFFKPKILEVAVTAMELQGFIRDIERNIGNKPFSHGAIDTGIGDTLVEFPGCKPEKNAGGLQFSLHVSNPELQGLELVQGLAEGPAFLQIGHGFIKGKLGPTQGTGRNIKASSIEALHGDLETISFMTEAVLKRNLEIVEPHFGSGLGIPPHFVFKFAEG